MEIRTEGQPSLAYAKESVSVPVLRLKALHWTGILLSAATFSTNRQQLIMDGRGIGKDGAFSALYFSLNKFIDHGSGGIMSYICNDRNIRLDPAGNHFSAPQSNFFLNGIHHI